MKTHFVTPLLVLVLLGTCLAQNLIPNPGFENNLTSWGNLWTRSGDSGAVTIVSSPVHSGTKALHLSYTGHQDYSFSSQNPIAVKEGQIYQFTSFVRVDSMTKYCQLSVTLFTSTGQTSEWSWAIKDLSKTNGIYKQFSTQFVIPTGITKINPRFIGYGGPVTMYIDDVSLILVDSIASPQESYVLQNQVVSATISKASWQIILKDKQSGITFTTDKNYLFTITTVDSFPDSLRFHCMDLGDSIPLTILVWLQDNIMYFSLRADANTVLDRPFAFPGKIPSTANDYLIIPKGCGILWPATKALTPPLYEQFSLSDWSFDICMTGVTDLQKGYALITEDPWGTDIDFGTLSSNSPYSPQLNLMQEKGRFGYNRTFGIAITGTGGYVALAKSYRNHAERAGYVKTLTDKIKDNPNVDRLRGAIDFWFMGSGFWFSNASFFRKMTDFGLDRAIFSGAMAPSVVDTVNTLGFLTSEYDCYTNAYPPGQAGYTSDGFDTSIIIQQDGTKLESWLSYLDNGNPFQAYGVCSYIHADFAKARIAQALSKLHLNCRFIDVELAMSLVECYSKTHPVTKRTDAKNRIKLLSLVKNDFKLVTGGEQARDFAFPYIDYGEGTMSLGYADNAGYDWFTPVTNQANLKEFIQFNVDPTIRIPLHGLIYHDVHVPTWYTGDGASKVPAYWDDKDALNILYASMPLLMPPDTAYWSKNLDRFFETIHCAGGMFREAGFSPMKNHTFNSIDKKIQSTSFVNGWTVTTNFGSAAVTFENHLLAAKGYYATNGNYEIYKLQNGSQPLSVSKCSDRFYVNPHGQLTTVSGLRCIGSTYMKKETNFISLAFIGSQTSIDINPDSLPWPVSSVKIYTKDKSKEIIPISLTNGWLQIKKAGTENIYRIEGTFSLATHTFQMRTALPHWTASFTRNKLVLSFLGIESPIITLYAATGKRILYETTADKKHAHSNWQIDLKNIAAGMYFVNIRSGSLNQTRLIYCKGHF